MVFPDNYKFYDPIPTKVKVEESEKPLIPTDSDHDSHKGVRFVENPAPAYEQDAPLAKVTLTRSRTKELARPKTKAKPRSLDRFFDLMSRQSIFIKGLLFLFLTSIPFLMFMAIAVALPPTTWVGGKQGTLNLRLSRFSEWLVYCWGTFMALFYFGLGLSVVVGHVCAMSNALDKYKGLARAICTRIVLLFWAVTVWALIPVILITTQSQQASAEYRTMRNVFKFLVLTFAIILVQGILLQLIKIQYIEGFIGPRAAKARHELQILKDLDHLTRPPRRLNDLSTIGWVLKKLFAPVERTDYYYISHGRGDMDRWDNYAVSVWSQIAGTKESLTLMDICDQMDRMDRSADKEKARELFDELDSVTDGVVTENEVKELVHRVGLQLNRRTQAMTGIEHLSSKLETFLSLITLVLVVFVYGTIIDKTLGGQLKDLWTGMVALSFAFSGSVAEFVNAMVFCFGKHPYDVGDYVEIKTNKYIVAKIYLTHTQFEQVVNEHVRGLFCQMSHASLQTEPIINWTRTSEEAATRHADKATAKDDKTSKREDNVADLISAKLDYLKQTKTVSEAT